MEETRIAIFKGKEVRKTIHDKEWWFLVVDAVEALTDSVNPRDYWYKMKIRVQAEDGLELSTICRQLKLEASDGKKYETDCANTEGLFRIIQSIPSPKAEPFKRWLAKVGTDEWQKRGAEEKKGYEILTAEISRATFGVTPADLRDHMDDFELIFNMLGERSTTEIHRTEDSKGVPKLKADARAGGEIAGGARKQLEKKIGRSIVSKHNYLKPSKRTKRLQP